MTPPEVDLSPVASSSSSSSQQQQQQQQAHKQEETVRDSHQDVEQQDMVQQEAEQQNEDVCGNENVVKSASLNKNDSEDVPSNNEASDEGQLLGLKQEEETIRSKRKTRHIRLWPLAPATESTVPDTSRVSETQPVQLPSLAHRRFAAPNPPPHLNGVTKGIVNNHKQGGGGLFSRTTELEKLVQLAEAAGCGSRSIEFTGPTDRASTYPAACLVHGSSGSGKTALCQNLPKALRLTSSEKKSVPDTSSSSPSQSSSSLPPGAQNDQQPIFIEGKFDQYVGVSKSYSVIIDAFDKLGLELRKLIKQEKIGERTQRHLNSPHSATATTSTESLLSHSPHHSGTTTVGGHGSRRRPTSASFTSVQACVEQALSYKGNMLAQIIPSLRSFDDASEVAATSSDALMLAHERFVVAIIYFLQIICTHVRPVILFLDDWQWSDEPSRQLLLALMERQQATSPRGGENRPPMSPPPRHMRRQPARAAIALHNFSCWEPTGTTSRITWKQCNHSWAIMNRPYHRHHLVQP